MQVRERPAISASHEIIQTFLLTPQYPPGYTRGRFSSYSVMKRPPHASCDLPIWKTPFLSRLRRRLRHAWLLHTWLICALLLMPAGRLVRADDDEEEFIWNGEIQSAVEVSISVSGDTYGMVPGDTRQVDALVQAHS